MSAIAIALARPRRPPSCPAQNAEILTLTYGSIVRQLVTDYEDVEEVNRQLDQMCAPLRTQPARSPDPPAHQTGRVARRGYNIGQRLIDEFLARSKTQRCSDFRETADKIAKAGFKMFLNVTAAVTDWNAEGTECSLVRARPAGARGGRLPAAPSRRRRPAPQRPTTPRPA
jgi:hypothetical protein